MDKPRCRQVVGVDMVGVDRWSFCTGGVFMTGSLYVRAYVASIKESLRTLKSTCTHVHVH